MESTWSTSPFDKFNGDNLKYSEALRSEARFFQELSKINELHAKCHNLMSEEQQKESGRSSKFPSEDIDARILSNQNLLSEENRKATSRSVSCLQGTNIPKGKTVMKVYSKTTLKKKEQEDGKVSETEIKLEEDSFLFASPEISSNERNLNPENTEAGVNWKAFDFGKQGKGMGLNKKKKSQSRGEERNIGNPLVSCPVELVEIYPVKKDNRLSIDGRVPKMNEEKCSMSSPKEDEESSKSTDVEENGCLSFGARSKKIWPSGNNLESTVRDNGAYRKISNNIPFRTEEASFEPTRDRQNSNTEKMATDMRKIPEMPSIYNRNAFKENLKSVVSQFKLDNNLDLNSTSEDSSKSSLKEKEGKVFETIDLKRPEGSRDLPKGKSKEAQRASAIQEDPRVSRLRRLFINSKELSLTEDEKFVNNLVSPRMLPKNRHLVVAQEKDNNLKSQNADSTSSYVSSASDSNNVIRQDSTSSNESKTSRSSVPELSKTEPSSRENTLIDLKKIKSNPETINSDTESPKEKNMKIIIQKRDMEMTTKEIKFNSCDKGGGMLKVVDEEDEEYREPQKKKTEMNLMDTRNEIIKSDNSRTSIGLRNMKLSNILIKIYQHLAYDWQRMKCIKMKLQGSVSDDSDRFMTMIRLLGKTITRYKSYIHVTNDESKAETEIIKLSLKYIQQLTVAVNKCKSFLDGQERQLDCPQLKTALECDTNEKRRILNDVIWFSNEWTNEVSNSIETISNMVKNVITDYEEKENVKDPRRYKSMNRRASNTSPNYKHKNRIRSQAAKANLTKKESLNEILCNVEPVREYGSKTSIKTEHASRNKERMKLLDIGQNAATEEKTYKGRVAKKQTQLSANQWKQSIIRSKFRTSSNAQPVWRPGGTAKIPASCSTTVLRQKSRTLIQAKEKANQPIRSTKEMKQGRVASESRKKITADTYSIKDATIARIPDHPKVSTKTSSTSLKASLRPKSKTGTRATASKGNNAYHQGTESLYLKNPEKIIKQKTSKEQRVHSMPEEMLSPRANPVESKSATDEIHPETDFIYLNSIATAEKVNINEEEPTRDTDPSLSIKDRSKISQTINENLHIIEKLSKQSLTPLSTTIVAKDLPSFPTSIRKDTVDKNLGNSQSKIQLNFAPMASTSCMTDFPSSLDPAAKMRLSNYCQTTFNSIPPTVFYQTPRNEAQSQVNCIDDEYEGKTRSTSAIKEKKSRTSSHGTSLSMLKEFLCEQGVDRDLVNKAEQRMKEKQKARNCFRRKSTNSVNMLFDVKNSHTECPKEDRSVDNIENCKGDSSERENSNNVDKIRNCSTPRTPVIKKDAATCMEINFNDASSQTSPPWRLNKGSQCIPEIPSVKQRASAVQTETTLMKDFATEYQEQMPKEMNNLVIKNRDVSSMTEMSLIGHNFRDILQVSYASKSVGTEQVDSIRTNDSTENIEQVKSVEVHNEVQDSTDEQDLSKTCHHVFHTLFNQMHDFNEPLANYRINGEALAQSSTESETSVLLSSSDLSSMGSENCIHNETMQGESHKLPARKVSSEMVAALQIAALRAHNVYRAIDVYKQNLQEKLQKLKKRREEIVKQNRQPRRLSVFRSSSVTNVTKRLGDFGETDIVEMSRTLRHFEVLTTSSKDSEQDISESVSMPSTSVPISESIEKIEMKISNKSSSKIVVKDTTISKETLVQETKTRSYEEIHCVERISSTCTTLSPERTESERMQRNDRFSVFSRENLLPLVYAVVCSVVYWCLQFTITCDIIS